MQSIQVEQHQPQALTRRRLLGMHRIFQHHAHGVVLGVGEQNGSLLDGCIDRINLAFDLEIGRTLAENEIGKLNR